MVVYSPLMDARPLKDVSVNSNVEGFISVMMSLVHPARRKACAQADPIPAPQLVLDETSRLTSSSGAGDQGNTRELRLGLGHRGRHVQECSAGGKSEKLHVTPIGIRI